MKIRNIPEVGCHILLARCIGNHNPSLPRCIGVSKHTIISVENGRNKLSKNLDKRIQLATGAQILDKKFRFGFPSIPPPKAAIS